MTNNTNEMGRLESILRSQRRLRQGFAATAILFSTSFSALVVAFFQAAQ
jgi:hypothetical protein